MYIKQNSFFRKNQFAREFIRNIFTRFHFYQESKKKDILLFSSMRSGSTWLMEVISREPKLNYINEPNGFRFVSRSKIKSLLDHPQVYKDDILFSVPEQLKSKIVAYFVEPAQTRLSSPYNIFRKNFHLFVNRRILKINDFNPCIEFMLGLGFNNMYLIRHPIPTVISSVKTNIRYQTSAYLGNESYRQNFLTDEQYHRALEIQAEGNEYEQRALCWSLSHLPIWLRYEQKGKDKDCLLMTYEELQVDPDFMIRKLADHLELSAVEEMLEGVAIPSASTSDARLSSATFNGKAKISEWMKPENEEIIHQIFEVINVFGIGFYNVDSPTIIEKYSQLNHTLSEKA